MEKNDLKEVADELLLEVDRFLATNSFLGESAELSLPKDIAELQDSFYEDECGLLSELGVIKPHMFESGRLTQTDSFEEKIKASITKTDSKPKAPSSTQRMKF